MNATLAVTAVGAATAGAGVVVGVAAPTDWSGISQAIQALGVLILAFGTAITAVIQARQKKDVEDTKALMQETKSAVDGGMTKLLDAKTAEATATATLAAEAAQRERKGIEDAATLKEKERAAAAGPATVAATTPVAVEVVAGPAAGTDAIRTKTDPMEAAEAAHAAAVVKAKGDQP